MPSGMHNQSILIPPAKPLSISNLQSEQFLMIQCASGQYVAAVPYPEPGQKSALFREKVWRIRRRKSGGYTIQGWHLGFLSIDVGTLSMMREDVDSGAIWILGNLNDENSGWVTIRGAKKVYLFHNPKHPQLLRLKKMSKTPRMESGFRFRLRGVNNCTSVHGCWDYPAQTAHFFEGLFPVHRPFRHSYPDTKLLPLLLFTSPKDMSQLGALQLADQRTVFRLWGKLPSVTGLVLTKDNATEKEAMAHGLLLDSTYKSHPPFQQPSYKDLFDRAFEVSAANCVAYSNGDILYTRDLVETATFLQQQLRSTGFLAVGVRINTKGREIPDRGWEEAVVDMARNGVKYMDWAEDYFIITRNVWQSLRGSVPDFIVGGVAFDNWLVNKAIRGGHMVVDCSNTIIAVHLNHGEMKESHSKPKSPFNIEKAQEHGGWDRGSIAHCPWFTYRNPVTGAFRLWTRHSPLLYY
eukprot:GGOE01015134.1.p1 GENE.GGOE01015134.1~~GGOE01015134.1.p1  ORF type:complete len:487 (+),score=70.69 GGOE01015134.1:71-1462(+)